MQPKNHFFDCFLTRNLIFNWNLTGKIYLKVKVYWVIKKLSEIILWYLPFENDDEIKIVNNTNAI